MVVQAYLNVSSDKTNPLHEKIGCVSISWLKRGDERITRAEGKFSVPRKDSLKLEGPLGATNVEIFTLVEEQGRLGVLVMFEDGEWCCGC